MKVAMIVTPLDIPGGGARQALKLARELQALGHEPTLITPALDRARCYPDLLEGLEVRVARPGAALRRIEWVGGFANLDTLRRAPIFACASLVGREFDVINAHDQTANWPAARAGRRLGLPTVWMCNEPPFWHHQLAQRQAWQQRLAKTPARALDPEWVFLHAVDFGAARAMDRVVVLDRKNEARVRRVYGRESVVVRSGVDADFFSGRSGAEIREELGLDGAFVMLHVGYAAPWKGQSDALRALKALEHDLPQARLVLVGQAVRAAFAPQAADLGLTDKVTFMEGISDLRLAELYAACDVLLFPADQTWGLNVTEAMAAGKPAIVSDAAGVSEVLEDGATGFVVPHGDAAAVAARALLLANDDLRRRSMGEAGRAFVRENLTWRAYAEGMLRVFKDAVAARPTS